MRKPTQVAEVMVTQLIQQDNTHISGGGDFKTSKKRGSSNSKHWWTSSRTIGTWSWTV